MEGINWAFWHSAAAVWVGTPCDGVVTVLWYAACLADIFCSLIKLVVFALWDGTAVDE